MRSQDSHLSDQDLLLAADGELTGRRAEEVRGHLTSCWTCRTRLREIEDAIADYVRIHSSESPSLPPGDGARALLKARMAEISRTAVLPPWWQRIVSTVFERRALALAGAAFILLVGIVAFRSGSALRSSRRPMPRHEFGITPDPRLTPGATLPVTTEDVCAADVVESAHVVPPVVALRVFAAYGIEAPPPRAYEVDYLITPALGGSDSIRNFWPQPYGTTVWNAHIKDALEDHLRGLVCGRQLDLATAQHDLARDWIAAYKKYFRTDKPLPEHSSFLKDRPWE